MVSLEGAENIMEEINDHAEMYYTKFFITRNICHTFFKNIINTAILTY